ncbi:hypothetical protein AB0L13_37060 [Saccharopolyspora shandongensis]|uniref:hypothetical protein n=1 Tax=Saccharopolyspora shandongensis TaxID=418495 RepID=UPI00342C94E2
MTEAAAKIPGITVVRDAKDPSGRPGNGISFPVPGPAEEMLVFDPVTHAYIGSTFEAELELVIVDQAGQRP